jgi:ketosteroid isomerase-like protein
LFPQKFGQSSATRCYALASQLFGSAAFLNPGDVYRADSDFYAYLQSSPHCAKRDKSDCWMGLLRLVVSLMKTNANETKGTGTPEQLLNSIAEGINTGNLGALLQLYEPDAAFAVQPGSLSHGAIGVREALAGFLAMKGKLDLKVTRVLEAGGLALVTGVWSFAGTGPDGKPVKLASKSADVLRRQPDGSWRFVIDNPWGTD